MEEEEENTGTVDVSWLKLETVYKEASKKHLGYKERKKKKEWIQEDTWDAMEERRNAKKKALDAKSASLKERLEREHSEKHQRVRRMAKRDKRKYLEDLANQAEKAASRGEQGVLFKITKQICGK